MLYFFVLLTLPSWLLTSNKWPTCTAFISPGRGVKSPKIYEFLMNVFLVTFSIGLILSLKLMSHVHREPKHIILLNYVFLLICMKSGFPVAMRTGALWAETLFAFLTKDEKRRLYLNRVKPLKSPKPSLWASKSCSLLSNWFFLAWVANLGGVTRLSI